MAVLSGSLPLLNQTSVLQASILSHPPLDFLHIFLIKFGDLLSRFKAHMSRVLLLCQCQSRQDLQRRRCHSTLLKYVNLLESQLKKRKEEKRRTLFVEASLNKITPLSSIKERASWVKNKLAPSTMYLKRGVPSLFKRLKENE